MALRINHNIAAFDAHRNLTSTERSMSLSMEKLSSGFRINRASDDPAGLVISEQFRAQIAGMNQAIENSEGSINMIQTAEGALTEINNLLVKMRQLAIHAANEGFNDIKQLEADQAEIENSIATIDRIAANTQFGTKLLLDGSRDNTATITSADDSGLTIKESGLTTGAHSINATKTADATATLNSTNLGVELQTGGTVYNLADGLHDIEIVQASEGAQRTGDAVHFTDAFGTKLTLATTAQYASMSQAAVAATALAAHAGDYQIVLNYQEAGSNAVGEQTLSFTVATGDTVGAVATRINTAIASNASLAGKVVAASVANATIGLTTTGKGAEYSLRYVSSTETATTAYFDFGGSAINSRGYSDDVMNMTINTANASDTTAPIDIVAAASKTFTDMAELVADINTALDTAFGDVGDGSTNNVYAYVAGTNNDQIRFITSDEGSDYNIKVNSTGAANENAENVLGYSIADQIALDGTDALVSLDGYTNEITTVKYNSTINYTLENMAGTASTVGRGTVDMTINTAANGVNVGELLLDVTEAQFSVRLDGGAASTVTAGVDSTVWNSARTEWLKVNYELTAAGGSESISNTDSSLVFQIGANVGQTAKVSIAGMSSTALGNAIAGNIYASLSAIDVTSAAGAQDAQEVIDQAMTDVTSARGKLGSFQKNTLESNLRNLRSASQNLTASESAIRDTDMAAEMSTFVKYQILLQAGTAMLAQANQVPQVVLSLFR